MGMYDTVVFKCPNCNEDIEEQNKSGDCVLDRFRSDEVPVEIARDMISSYLRCDHCDQTFKMKFKNVVIKSWGLELVEC